MALVKGSHPRTRASVRLSEKLSKHGAAATTGREAECRLRSNSQNAVCRSFRPTAIHLDKKCSQEQPRAARFTRSSTTQRCAVQTPGPTSATATGRAASKILPETRLEAAITTSRPTGTMTVEPAEDGGKRRLPSSRGLRRAAQTTKADSDDAFDTTTYRKLYQSLNHEYTTKMRTSNSSTATTASEGSGRSEASGCVRTAGRSQSVKSYSPPATSVHTAESLAAFCNQASQGSQQRVQIRPTLQEHVVQSQKIALQQQQQLPAPSHAVARIGESREGVRQELLQRLAGGEKITTALSRCSNDAVVGSGIPRSGDCSPADRLRGHYQDERPSVPSSEGPDAASRWGHSGTALSAREQAKQLLSLLKTLPSGYGLNRSALHSPSPSEEKLRFIPNGGSTESLEPSSSSDSSLFSRIRAQNEGEALLERQGSKHETFFEKEKNRCEESTGSCVHEHSSVSSGDKGAEDQTSAVRQTLDQILDRLLQSQSTSVKDRVLAALSSDETSRRVDEHTNAASSPLYRLLKAAAKLQSQSGSSCTSDRMPEVEKMYRDKRNGDISDVAETSRQPSLSGTAAQKVELCALAGRESIAGAKVNSVDQGKEQDGRCKRQCDTRCSTVPADPRIVASVLRARPATTSLRASQLSIKQFSSIMEQKQRAHAAYSTSPRVGEDLGDQDSMCSEREKTENVHAPYTVKEGSYTRCVNEEEAEDGEMQDSSVEEGDSDNNSPSPSGGNDVGEAKRLLLVRQARMFPAVRGVYFDTRSGNLSWRCSWKVEGKKRSRSWSVLKFGMEGARAHAIAERLRQHSKACHTDDVARDFLRSYSAEAGDVIFGSGGQNPALTPMSSVSSVDGSESQQLHKSGAAFCSTRRKAEEAASKSGILSTVAQLLHCDGGRQTVPAPGVTQTTLSGITQRLTPQVPPPTGTKEYTKNENSSGGSRTLSPSDASVCLEGFDGLTAAFLEQQPLLMSGVLTASSSSRPPYYLNTPQQPQSLPHPSSTSGACLATAAAKKTYVPNTSKYTSLPALSFPVECQPGRGDFPVTPVEEGTRRSDPPAETTLSAEKRRFALRLNHETVSCASASNAEDCASSQSPPSQAKESCAEAMPSEKTVSCSEVCAKRRRVLRDTTSLASLSSSVDAPSYPFLPAQERELRDLDEGNVHVKKSVIERESGTRSMLVSQEDGEAISCRPHEAISEDPFRAAVSAAFLTPGMTNPEVATGRESWGSLDLPDRSQRVAQTAVAAEESQGAPLQNKDTGEGRKPLPQRRVELISHVPGGSFVENMEDTGRSGHKPETTRNRLSFERSPSQASSDTTQACAERGGEAGRGEASSVEEAQEETNKERPLVQCEFKSSEATLTSPESKSPGRSRVRVTPPHQSWGTTKDTKGGILYGSKDGLNYREGENEETACSTRDEFPLGGSTGTTKTYTWVHALSQGSRKELAVDLETDTSARETRLAHLKKPAERTGNAVLSKVIPPKIATTGKEQQSDRRSDPSQSAVELCENESQLAVAFCSSSTLPADTDSLESGAAPMCRPGTHLSGDASCKPATPSEELPPYGGGNVRHKGDVGSAGNQEESRRCPTDAAALTAPTAIAGKSASMEDSTTTFSALRVAGPVAAPPLKESGGHVVALSARSVALATTTSKASRGDVQNTDRLTEDAFTFASRSQKGDNNTPAASVDEEFSVHGGRTGIDLPESCRDTWNLDAEEQSRWKFGMGETPDIERRIHGETFLPGLKSWSSPAAAEATVSLESHVDILKVVHYEDTPTTAPSPSPEDLPTEAVPILNGGTAALVGKEKSLGSPSEATREDAHERIDVGSSPSAALWRTREVTHVEEIKSRSSTDTFHGTSQGGQEQRGAQNTETREVDGRTSAAKVAGGDQGGVGEKGIASANNGTFHNDAGLQSTSNKVETCRCFSMNSNSRTRRGSMAGEKALGRTVLVEALLKLRESLTELLQLSPRGTPPATHSHTGNATQTLPRILLFPSASERGAPPDIPPEDASRSPNGVSVHCEYRKDPSTAKWCLQIFDELLETLQISTNGGLSEGIGWEVKAEGSRDDVEAAAGDREEETVRCRNREPACAGGVKALEKTVMLLLSGFLEGSLSSVSMLSQYKSRALLAAIITCFSNWKQQQAS